MLRRLGDLVTDLSPGVAGHLKALNERAEKKNAIPYHFENSCNIPLFPADSKTLDILILFPTQYTHPWFPASELCSCRRSADGADSANVQIHRSSGSVS